ncbi:glycosyltransferase family protein [Parabacteroides gordonii]|uniref:Glycosyltransferase subfamily 4-like N-terminal domain-containing protein n=1 Tax=Parabacteroides gordonii MS-1 = DSM 23371 TaxID=1203610 RepID=A0A0F5IUK1_9BACT|nr:hypothetical protein [Parabacteroides gordonii]KKB49224.1 hypothetical protein HMPREF1536_04288 [Parabacteroides gordonii MS-1 = DSM 23371]MCA5585494.1 hypothetical protein [Parabacteroides gordonii]RGP16792.1 hypothetical protein DXB27_08715 [Parabacteroides gordonii]
MQKKVVIINKYGALHPSATGRPVRKLADYLWENGVDVIVLSIHASYKGQVSQQEEKLPYQTIELPDFYSGTNKWFRLLGNLVDGFRLIAYSLLLPQHQLKVVLTDPSLINIWAILFRPFSRSKLVFWTMDLYPEAFTSAGLISCNNLIYRMIFSFVYRHVPDFLITLGEQQYRYLCRQYKRPFIPHIVLPCGVCQKEEAPEPSWRQANRNKIIFCYAGNIGEAHNDAFLLELIRQLDPEKHLILLRLYGAKAKLVLKEANAFESVILLDYISSAEMRYVDICVASLLSMWNHVCVPSKVVSAICCGLPVLYNADEKSEGACMFPDAIWLLPNSENQLESVSAFLSTLSVDDISEKKEAAGKYAQKLISERYSSYSTFLRIIK